MEVVGHVGSGYDFEVGIDGNVSCVVTEGLEE